MKSFNNNDTSWISAEYEILGSKSFFFNTLKILIHSYIAFTVVEKLFS